MPETRALGAAVAADPVLAGALDAVAAAAAPGVVVRLGGAPEGSWPLLAWRMAERLDSPVLVVTVDPETMAAELALLDGIPKALVYPGADVLPMDREPPSDEVVGARLAAQADLLSGTGPRLVLASPMGLMRPSPPPDVFRDGLRELRVGSEESVSSLVAWLLEWGFVREPQVEGPGQFATRGGIVDIFPPSGRGPIRVEFFGDEVESIRGFELGSQASITRRERVTLLPAREFPHRAEDVAAAEARLRALDLSGCQPEVRESWAHDIARLSEAGYFPGIESLYPYLAERPACLLDYFQARPPVLLVEPERARGQAERHLRHVEELIADEAALGELPRGLTSGLVPWARVEIGMGPILEIDRVAHAGDTDLGWGLAGAGAARLEEQVPLLRASVGRGERVLLLTQQDRRVLHLLEDQAIPTSEVDEVDVAATPIGAGVVTVMSGGLRSGFRLPASGLSVLTDLELFGAAPARPHRRRTTRGQASDASRAFKLEVAAGSLVVHRDHGVGVFLGLRSLEDGGTEREYISLEYAGGDKVFVPVEHLDRLQLYVGGGGEEGETPKLSRLGTGEWDRVKRKVKQAVEEMAGELIQIYARREVASGHAYSPDGAWQAQLESNFPYQETPDQVRAIEEIKADMESPRPMDRLLCGDVGFGKTEVALRAAFKAAADGKQVAVLVPTTVLANQHYLTFKERLEPFPVRVEMLSRFVSDADAVMVRQGLSDGTVDIVIGTHRILTGSVRFKDLGLLIIDEEQRFGVAQKERMRRTRASIDVLSMSATPIPRTLHMSLGGIRDLSVLATPPEERQPVRTFVTADQDNLVREVIMRELDRHSQVFFLHNRVRTIQKAAERIRRLVPEARVGVAHGQMDEHQLAEMMVRFIHREFDVLVCTTIIESGLDIPTANLIIVEDADRFGLADLYQLRGRVGRSGSRAYAYFLYDPQRSLTEGADKRLDVIGSYQELGAGFKLALRDLEIRGAGNLLGREQSGEIAAVGLEMYNEMLRNAVGNLGGQAEVVDDAPPLSPLELPIDHYLPADYVPDEKVRLQVYQELAAASREVQLQTLARRLKDRFGTLPGAVENLLFSLRVK
ncbi:MAG: transcription-repair coupling factor, partial [Candidatus Dormibacteria bacterium]